MTNPDIRAAFEKRFGPNDSFAWRDENDNYKVAALQSAWEIWQAATEAAKATGTACTTCKGTGLVDDGEINHYLNGEPYMCGPVKCVKDCPDCTRAARHDKDGNHADDLRGMLDELQTKFDKQQSAFWACSEKLAQVQRNQETELSDIRILELAEEDFGDQDDRNVKNEALLSFARKVQAARQPAPVAQSHVYEWLHLVETKIGTPTAASAARVLKEFYEGAEPDKSTQPEATKPAQDLGAAILAMNRAKLLPIWDNDVPHKLHVELDVIFKALAALASPADALVAGDTCTCPSGDGSLRWPCPQHPPLPVAITDKKGPNGIKWYVEPNLPDGVNLYIKEQK